MASKHSPSSPAASAALRSGPHGRALPRVFFMGSDYVSHRRAGADYQAQLAELGCETDNLDEAEVVLLHLEAPMLAELLQQVPALGEKYVVNYCVWESSELPEVYVQGLELVDEVWTASSFCAGILYKAGFAAHWLPHAVVANPPGDIPAAAWAKAHSWLGDAPDRFDVLSVTKQGDLRKNNPLLCRAFAALRRRNPRARLIIKSGSWLPEKMHSYGVQGGIVSLEGPTSDEVMAALMQHCQLYASASHSEGWGLGLTEAMARGVPVVSPAYGGSLTFLSAQNSLLVPVHEDKIVGSWGLFNSAARWGHPVRGALEEALVQAYEEHGTPAATERIARARADVQRFAPKQIKNILRNHLQRIGERLDAGFVPPARHARTVTTSPKAVRTALRGD